MALETHVVVLEEENYKNGNGYRGPILKELGFPEGPYLPGIAKIFINQARRVDKTKRFVIKEYVEE